MVVFVERLAQLLVLDLNVFGALRLLLVRERRLEPWCGI